MIAIDLTHAVATLFMTAVIWFVQVVHYPLFAQVGPSAFPSYEAAHVRRITFVVMPAMLLELGTAVALVGFGSAQLGPVAAATGLGLLVVIWGSTGLIQVPLHSRLGQAHSEALVSRLVMSNWVRTGAWTARAAIVVVGLAHALG